MTISTPECPTVVVGSPTGVIRLPAGAVIGTIVTETVPSPFQAARHLLVGASPALAALAPFFTLLDAVLAVKGVLDAIPGSLGPPPDPTALIQKLNALAPKIDRLLGIVPQLSVPLLAIDLIDAVIATIESTAAQLQEVAAQETRISAAEVLAGQPGNAALTASVECAREVNETIRASVVAGLGPVGPLLSLLGAMLGLVPGGPSIPPLDALPADVAAATAQLESFVETLRVIRGAIPAP